MIRLTVYPLLVCSLASLGPIPFADHPFHRSQAHIDFNPKSQTFEVALCVFPDDLAAAIAPSETDFDIADVSKVDQLAAEYVAKRLVIGFADSKSPMPVQWVGHEFDEQQVWLYFELDVGQHPENATLSIANDIMFELFDDQQNDVFLQTDGCTRLLIFGPETDRTLTVAWKSKEVTWPFSRKQNK